MSVLADGFGGYLTIMLAGVAAHEPWRWLGLVLGRSIDTDSEIFHWVRAVATALVAGLVLRIVIFAPGALAEVPTWMRLAAFMSGIGIFYATRKNLAAGILGGATLMVLGKLMMS